MGKARLFHPVATITTTVGSVQLDLPDHPEPYAVAWIVQGDARVLRLILPGLIRHRRGRIRILVQAAVIAERRHRRHPSHPSQPTSDP